MSGFWNPTHRQQLEAENQGPEAWPLHDEWASHIYQLAAQGDVGALEILREQLPPVDDEELGWGEG